MSNQTPQKDPKDPQLPILTLVENGIFHKVDHMIFAKNQFGGLRPKVPSAVFDFSSTEGMRRPLVGVWGGGLYKEGGLTPIQPHIESVASKD